MDINYNEVMDLRLLQGCCREADRADMASLGLDGLKSALPENFQGHHHLTAITEEIRSSSRILRDLADRSQIHFPRVPIVLNYLNVVLPCLCKTLRDIIEYYEDRTKSRETRWRTMYHKMTDESGGIPLPQRFVLYNHFLGLLRDLLTRSPNFDLNTLELLRTRILELRGKRGIPPPPAPVGPMLRPEMIMAAMQEPNVHWAEQIFSVPLTSRTAMEHQKQSKSFGPYHRGGPHLESPPDAKILFRRPFDHDRLCLIVFLNTANRAPYLMIRTYDSEGPWFTMRGAHELCIRRDGSSLQLKRWSQHENRAKLWASLYFQTWEEMVLLWCSFVSLKARNTLTVQISPEEFKLRGERRLFQAQIIDDGFKHSLIVYKDDNSKGIRLHAAVWEGELQRCPVWTAFVTHQCVSPTWLERKSKHRVWLKDVQLYIFCQKYRHQNQRKGKAGAFEIYFISETACQKFQEVFSPPPTPATTTVSSGTTDNTGAGPSR